jgi:hypothetical protein
MSLPAGADGSLGGVSCSAPRACTAVGSYYFESGLAPGGVLAERWNGSSWKIQSTPSPAGMLNAVSCPTRRACTAVGYSVNRTGNLQTLAERWNGISWRIQPTPSPSAIENFLSAVSCPVREACTAVGTYVNSTGGFVTLAERWNGTSWVVQPTPNPAVSFVSSLSGVSCSTRRYCTAVGAGVFGSLAERWRFGSWQIETTPNPVGGGTNAAFNGVSCATRQSCAAVGNYQPTNGLAFTLAERFSLGG